MKKIIIAVSAIAFLTFACTKEEAEEEETTTTPTPTAVLFATDVLPIFHASCGTGSTCHSTSNHANGKVYETHAGASSVPGATTKGAINHSAGFHKMPQVGAKLSTANIQIIETWIDDGMKND